MNLTNSIDDIWFTSDQHFGHENIIKYCSRPFCYVAEMNATIIERWNSVVKPNDLVFNLGDLTMSWKKEKIQEIYDQLNGTKILIKGNHDHRKTIPVDAFVSIHDHLQITGDGFDFILIHDPATASANHSSPQKYLCGHLHSSPDRRIYYNWIDVGVDAHDFTPVSLRNLLKLFEDETKKGLSPDELLQRSTSGYNQYVQRRRDPSRPSSNVSQLSQESKSSI